MTAANRDAELMVELSKLTARHGMTTTERRDDPSEELLLAVAAFQDIARIASELQGQAVRTAHESGISWARIGAILGISRQAVQQRFDPSYIGSQPNGPETRLLGPVTRAEEMRHLEVAGTQGWKLVSARHGEHELEHAGGVWEITRVSVLSPRAMPAASEGWEAAATRFPDCFYVRPSTSAARRP